MTSTSAFDLTGTHVLITGGSRGLGKAISVAVARAGAVVTIVARNADQVDQTVAEIRDLGGLAHGKVADVAELSTLADLADECAQDQPLDGVVHAAAVQLRKPAVEVTVDEFVRVQTLNLHAPYILSAAVARQQIAAGRSGSHVFIGSLNSTIGLPNVSPYVVSKTGLVGMSRAMSTEWARHHIRANVVAPGYFNTEMTAGLLANEADRTRILSRIPMGDLGHPDDVGNACVFLLSPAARYTTGTLLNVDGGWLAA